MGVLSTQRTLKLRFVFHFILHYTSLPIEFLKISKQWAMMFKNWSVNALQMLKSLISVFVCLLFPIEVLSDTWAGSASKIKGFELTSLGKYENGYYTALLDGESKEFFNHCSRRGMVHVSGFASPARCEIGDRNTGEFFEIKLFTKEPLHRSRMTAISKKEIPPRMQLFDFSNEELEMLKKADHQFVVADEKDSSDCYQKRYKEMDENSAEINRQIGKAAEKRTTTYRRDHQNYLRTIKASSQYKKFYGKKFKFLSPNGFLYISSVGLDSCDLMGWNIVNVVYKMENEKMVSVTSFDGCIEGGFRDLNGDGIPEVLTYTCENSESSNASYWTIYPKAEILMQR